jgi:two-component system cell cycle sensor histidine kinase/response regulator CckA
MANALHSSRADQPDLAREVSPVQLLSANLAHVLTQWMTLIMRDSTYLTENLPTGSVSHEHASRILDTTRQVAGLTRRLAAMGKLSDPHVLPGVQLLLIGNVVQQAYDYIAEACRRRHVELRWNPTPSGAQVLAEPDLLLTCLINLFSNALDAMPGGGELLIDIKTDKQWVVLRIRDNGHGIPQDHLSKIYEPLFTTRAPHTSTAGLGLTIVRFAMARWGGKLSIRSREGKGVICRLTLPLAPRTSPHKETPVQRNPDTILVVEDHGPTRAEVVKALQIFGCTVLEAATALDAVSLVRRHRNKIRLALVDLVLPDRDGKTVANSVFAISPSTGVVILSGFSRDYVKSCIRRGAWGYLQKPLDITQLQNTVRSYLTDHRSGNAGLTTTLTS